MITALFRKGESTRGYRSDLVRGVIFCFHSISFIFLSYPILNMAAPWLTRNNLLLSISIYTLLSVSDVCI